MARKKQRLEFRYYDIPAGEYVLPKLGKGWEIEYGKEYGRQQHFHNYLEIGYCYHGKGELIIEDRVYNYGDKMFTIIPENVPHTTISAPGNVCKWEFLFVDVKAFVRDEMNTDLSKEEILRILNKRGTMKTAKNHPNLAKLILKIMDECRGQSLYYKECVKGYLCALVIEVLRLDEELEQAKRRNRISSYIQNTVSYVEQHYTQEIGIADMARNCGLSESHFRRVFEENMNMKPLEYVNMVRINAACELIRKEGGRLSMEEIGFRVGYTTPSTFNRNFRRLTSMTPNQWKHEHGTLGTQLTGFSIHALKGWEVEEEEYK